MPTSTSATAATVPDQASEVLAAAREKRRLADRLEVDLLELAVTWVDQHPADGTHSFPATIHVGGQDTELAIAGPGCPTIAEFAVPEFAAAIGVSTEAGKAFLGEAVEICYRLPRLWTRVRAGDLPSWRARRVARETIQLTPEAAGWVDVQIAPHAHKLGPAQLDRTVHEAIGRHMPDEVARLAEESWDKRHVTIFDQAVSFTGTMHVEADLDIADAVDLDTALTAGAARLAALGSTEPIDVRRAQAVGDLARAQLSLDLNAVPDHDARQPAVRMKARQAVIYVHLSQAAVAGTDVFDPVAKVERGNSLVWVEQVKDWCSHPDTQLVIRPVIDLDSCHETTTGEVPDRAREQTILRDRTCVFPWCTRTARRCDQDHVVPRARGGVTCPCNLAPLCRRHHRLKTHSPWSYTALEPGTYLWTSPHGYHFLRDPGGTLDVSGDRPPPDRPPDG